MPLFRCEECGCVENSALGDYHLARVHRRPVKCSECATGKWHGRFPKRSAKGMLIDAVDYLWRKDELKPNGQSPFGPIVGKVES